jgi:hypothetical protein
MIKFKSIFLIIIVAGKGKGKIKVEFPYNRPRRSIGGVEIHLYSFFNLADGWGGWSTPRPVALPPVKTWYPLYRWLVGPWAGLDWCGKSRPRRNSNPAPSYRRESLYRLNYPGPHTSWVDSKNIDKSIYKIKLSGRGSSVGISTRYGLDGPGIESLWGRDFPYLSRPALGPTQPPVQWVPGLSRG